MNRIKFYSKYDWACVENLKKIEKVLNEFNETKNYQINDIIEFYNCIKYFDNKCYLKDWTSEYIQEAQSKVKIFNKIIACFFLKITEDNLIDTIDSVEHIYIKDFWELFEKYKVYNRISNKKLDEIIRDAYTLEMISNFKDIVKYYGNIIREHFLKYEDSAIILLDKYEIVSENDQQHIYLPNEITDEDKELILKNYIESQNPNLNYLKIIFDMQYTKDMPISDKTRLIAKRKIKEQTDKLFNKNSGILMETAVKFSKDLKEAKNIEFNDQKIDCTYSSEWIANNTDYSTLLNNFIYLFEFTDFNMRINLISKESQLGTFEKHIFIQTKRSYKKGLVFDRLDMLSTLQITAYYKELEKINIRLENIIEWFFKEYLLNEFNISDYKINIPSKASNYLEKCRMMLSELDTILKEYRLIVEENEIDHELLQISSRPIPFDNIPSKVKNKYIYANSDEYNLISYLFFSDQCMLNYIERLEEKYDNFFDTIKNEKVKPEECPEYEQNNLKILISKNYLEIDIDGYLKFKNLERILIFKDINYNEVACYWKYSKAYQEEINKMIDEDILKSESTLFSRPEIDYFNYYLNKSEFSNGLDLRNIYVHGTQSQDHETSYMRILKIFILAIIKINDDLCTYYDEIYNKHDKNPPV